MNFLPEKKYGLPSWNFVKKNVVCEKGDEITRFDGTLFSPLVQIVYSGWDKESGSMDLIDKSIILLYSWVH